MKIIICVIFGTLCGAGVAAYIVHTQGAYIATQMYLLDFFVWTTAVGSIIGATIGVIYVSMTGEKFSPRKRK